MLETEEAKNRERTMHCGGGNETFLGKSGLRKKNPAWKLRERERERGEEREPRWDLMRGTWKELEIQ